MSNLTQLVAANGPTVAPGTVTSSQYYTPTGWSAGEYVYQTPTGEIAPRTTGGLGYNGLYNGGNVIITGSSFVPSPLQSVQYSPLYDYGTYTGATQAAGTQVGSTTTLATSTNTYGVYSFGLINGNVATVYTRQSDLQVVLDIRTPDGASVVSPISIPTATGSSSQPGGAIAVSGCCTTAGNLIITWYQDNQSQVKFAVYSQAGTLIQGATSTGAGSNPRYHQTIALAGGGWLLAGNGSSNDETRVLIATANNTFVNATASGFSTSMLGHSTVACQLTDGNIALATSSFNNSALRLGIMRPNGSLVFTPTSPISLINDTGSRVSIVALPSARFAVAYVDSGGSGNVSTWSYSNTAFTNLSNQNMTTTGFGLGCRATVNLDVNLGVKIYVLSGNSSSVMYIRQLDYTAGTASAPTLTNLVSSFNSTSGRMGTIVNTINGRATISWETPTGGNVSSASFAISTLTNGTTLYGGLYTLKENYTLLGVAATTVAAGGTGPVITNGGSVALNANYPLVTPVVQFSYQGVGTAFGQRGTVNNRVAVLKGLEL